MFFGALLHEGGVAVEPEFGGGEGELQESEVLQLAPTLEEEELSEKLAIGEQLEVTPYSGVNVLRQAAQFLHASSASSKQKIFGRVREAHVEPLRMKPLEIAQKQQSASVNPAPRFQDGLKQPREKERREREVFDVSDAFLHVEQRELVLILVPDWIRELWNRPNLTFWRLKRCFPGKRNAALRWCENFSCLCEKVGYESFQGGSLFRHGTCILTTS